MSNTAENEILTGSTRRLNVEEPHAHYSYDITKFFGAEILPLHEDYYPRPSKQGDGAIDLKARIEPLGSLALTEAFEKLVHYLATRNASVFVNGELINEESVEAIQEKVKDKFVVIYPSETATIQTGFKIATFCHIVGLVANFRVQPRSGLANKFGVTVLNSPGLVDPNYRGEVGVILTNLGSTIQIFTDKARIAQGVLALEGDPSAGIYRQVDKLSETNRGEGAYGSTGV